MPVELLPVPPLVERLHERDAAVDDGLGVQEEGLREHHRHHRPVDGRHVAGAAVERLVVEDDDRARIEMRKELKLGEGYCVGTFEWTYHDSTVDVRYYKDNGLDGKVSLVANTWGKPVPAPAPAPRRISGSSSGTCGSGNRGNGICSDEKCCSKWGWCGSSSEHCSNMMLRGNSYNTTEEGLDRDRDLDLDLETKVHVLTLIDEPHENDDWMVNNTNTAIDGNIDDDEPAITEKESYFYVDAARAFELELQMAAMTMDHGS